MKQFDKINQIQRVICFLLLLPLVMGIMISAVRASTQALYDAWETSLGNIQTDSWEYEMIDRSAEKEERERTDKYITTSERTDTETQGIGTSLMRQMKKDKMLLDMPDSELNHVICLDNESMDLSVPRADEYQVWYAETDIGQRKMIRISDTENATMLHTGYIMNKNLKKGYPRKENLDASGEHSNYNSEM